MPKKIPTFTSRCSHNKDDKRCLCYNGISIKSCLQLKKTLKGRVEVTHPLKLIVRIM